MIWAMKPKWLATIDQIAGPAECPDLPERVLAFADQECSNA